jgi:hypothetical protein
MSKERNLWLLQALVSVLVLAHCVAGDCSTADNSTCGIGNCQGYIMINSVCTSSCGPGSYYQNTTSMCVSCASLSQSTCTLYCPNFFFANSANGNSGNSTNSTNNTNPNAGPACQPCSTPYGPSCTACNSSVCTQCAAGRELTSNSQGCVDIRCNISNCAQCSGSKGCYLCDAGYQLSQSGTSCIAVNCSVNYCSRCVGSSCATCIVGYALKNGACQPICDLHCNNCISPGVCGGC